MKFSERTGRNPIKTDIQIDSIDYPLQVRLWNVLMNYFNRIEKEVIISNTFYRFIWQHFFNLPLDGIPHNSHNSSKDVYSRQVIIIINKWFFSEKTKWYEIYDLVEFISEYEPSNVAKFNAALEKETSGYRIIKNKVVPIISELEIQEIDKAFTHEWNSVNTHLETALNCLADRENLDYRNSIKESISAVEALCKIVLKDEKVKFGIAIKNIEDSFNIHPALTKAFSSLYGYTSDSSGIRHSLRESDNEVKFEEAKLMLVVCSAFINYLKTKI